MEQCAEHVEYQLPIEHTCVGSLLEGIVCPDPGLQTAMVSIHTDDWPTGMRNDFEAAVSHTNRFIISEPRSRRGLKRG